MSTKNLLGCDIYYRLSNILVVFKVCYIEPVVFMDSEHSSTFVTLTCVQIFDCVILVIMMPFHHIARCLVIELLRAKCVISSNSRGSKHVSYCILSQF